MELQMRGQTDPSGSVSAPIIHICEHVNKPKNSMKYREVLGSCDRASWAKYEERQTNKMQQLEVYY